MKSAYDIKILDKEEKELLKSIEEGEWKLYKNQDKGISELKKAATNTVRKSKHINIRISENDLFDLKTMALKEGLPYQTLISSILHKYVSGNLISSS